MPIVESAIRVDPRRFFVANFLDQSSEDRTRQLADIYFTEIGNRLIRCISRLESVEIFHVVSLLRLLARTRVLYHILYGVAYSFANV